jgi:hypothetical protein
MVGPTWGDQPAMSALIVNPYDMEEASAAMARALTMPPDDQRGRMHAMRTFLADFNVCRWAGRMLMDAARIRRRATVLGHLDEDIVRLASVSRLRPQRSSLISMCASVVGCVEVFCNRDLIRVNHARRAFVFAKRDTGGTEEIEYAMSNMVPPMKPSPSWCPESRSLEA